MVLLENTYEAVLEYLENLDVDDLISFHGNYCRRSSYEDEIYLNDEDFFADYFPNNVIDAVRAVSFGEYNLHDKYVQFNGLGNLQTTDYPTEWIDLDDLPQRS